MLKRIAVDTSPLRESRDFRLLITGQVISSLGTQIACGSLVAAGERLGNDVSAEPSGRPTTRILTRHSDER
jgi:hypothetical protein